MELAATQGVAAGLAFRFPNEILDACFSALIPELPVPSPFERDAMAWRIAARLPRLLSSPGFEQLRGYLGTGADDRRLLQISRTLADLFDQYVIFRPTMVLEWDKGQHDSGWQPVLWREISGDFPGMHRAGLAQMLRDRLSADASAPLPLPSRITLFGISYLPPFHLETFSLLAGHCDVTLYLQSPCRAYWGDLVSRQRLAELSLRDPSHAPEYYDTGNPLLSSLGTMGQEFHDLLLEYGFDIEDLDDDDAESPHTLLGLLKEDIRTLRDSGGRDERQTVPAGDRSLQIHSCHGPLREMEVLYDSLLAMFDEMDGLEPRHIAVMLPDMETYAPYITAVFGSRFGGRPPIPFTIADQSRRAETPCLETFFRILALPESRFGVNQVMELLESPPVMARFAITLDELTVIREWIRQTGVRWGLDAGQREALGFPPFNDFSWQAALDRLFIGYAMAPAEDRLFKGILPFDAIEGRGALPLGKLAAFLQAARRAAEQLAGRHTPARWADLLAGIAQELLRPDDRDNELKPLFDALQTLRQAERRWGFDAPLSHEALLDSLKGLMEQPGSGFGFLGGRVTFCAMLPMRSIPFRVVCLAGLNDGLFPRTRRQPCFSLMSGQRRRGDRSLRDEDRYLFLEALMAAGERLYISYTGQNDRDNSRIPPSVLAAELLDYVERGFVTAGTGEAPAILVRHRLQGFSPDYFTGDAGSSLFSYAAEYRDALARRQLAGPAVRRFGATPLPDDPALLERIDLAQLKRFFASPCAAFLATRLGIRPYRPGAEADECEPFAPDSLTSYALRQELVGRILSGSGIDGACELARARGQLPPGVAGRAAFDAIAAESHAFSGKVAPHLGTLLEPLPLSFHHDGMNLEGTLPAVRSGRHLVWRCGSMRGKDCLDLWLEHLVLNITDLSGYPGESMLICADRTLTLSPLGNAATILADLLELYREGLRRPLPLFPQVSWLFSTKGNERAETRWNGSDHAPQPAESQEPANAICFGDTSPLDAEFQTLSQRVFGPLLAGAHEAKTV
jgi:exodeoxyribonuclease V gamma subunit